LRGRIPPGWSRGLRSLHALRAAREKVLASGFKLKRGGFLRLEPGLRSLYALRAGAEKALTSSCKKKREVDAGQSDQGRGACPNRL